MKRKLEEPQRVLGRGSPAGFGGAVWISGGRAPFPPAPPAARPLASGCRNLQRGGEKNCKRNKKKRERKKKAKKKRQRSRSRTAMQWRSRARTAPARCRGERAGTGTGGGGWDRDRGLGRAPTHRESAPWGGSSSAPKAEGLGCPACAWWRHGMCPRTPSEAVAQWGGEGTSPRSHRPTACPPSLPIPPWLSPTCPGCPHGTAPPCSAWSPRLGVQDQPPAPTAGAAGPQGL